MRASHLRHIIPFTLAAALAALAASACSFDASEPIAESSAAATVPPPPEGPDGGVIESTDCADPDTLHIYDGPSFSGDQLCLRGGGVVNVDLSLATRGAGLCPPHRPCPHFDWAGQVRSFRTGGQSATFLVWDPGSGSYRSEHYLAYSSMDQASPLVRRATWVRFAE